MFMAYLLTMFLCTLAVGARAKEHTPHRKEQPSFSCI